MAKSKKVGRNDPCPCGSGKKFKKCCLEKMPSARPEREHSSDPRGEADSLYEALNLDRTVRSMGIPDILGGVRGTEEPPEISDVRCLEQILELDPGHPYASIDLGLYHLSKGDATSGHALLDKGSRSFLERCKDPKQVEEYLWSLADGLMDRFEFCEAIMINERLMGTAPGPGLDGKASCLAYLGKLDEALLASEAAVKECPQKPTYASNLGWIHLMRGQTAEARIALERALELDPKDEITKGNLMICKGMGRKDAPKDWVSYLLKGIPRSRVQAASRALRDSADDNGKAEALIKEYNGALLAAFKTELARRTDLLPAKKFDLYIAFGYFLSECWCGAEPWDLGYALPYSSIEHILKGYSDMMDRLVVRTSDVGKDILDDVNAALTEFYALLGRARLVSVQDQKELRSTIEDEYSGVLDRMARYNMVRRRPGATSEDKARARAKIYPRMY